MTEQESPEYRAKVKQIVELQAEVLYMNIDRTLATWSRTALALIIFGTVVDRFGLLLLHAAPAHVGTLLAHNPISSVTGLTLVGMGMFVAATATIRHQIARHAWIRAYVHSGWHGPWAAFGFALFTVVLGVVLLVFLIVFRR